MKVFAIYFLLIFIIKPLMANKYDCIIAGKKYEKKYSIPHNLLISIALTESGKKAKNGEFISWPWTINIKGKGKYFKDKEAAVNYVTQYTKQGKRNIDLGCMQVNYMYHPKAFNNFQDAFDPDKNVEWAAKMLKNLYLKFGSWKTATGYYHSYRNTRRKKYSAKVYKTLFNIEKTNPFSFIQIAEHQNITADNANTNKKYESLKLVENKIKNHSLDNNKDSETHFHSEYILARMEKVKFFRKYFYENNKN